MIGVVALLAILGGLATFVLVTLKRGGPGVGRGTGFSIRRGPASHYNIDGRPKRAYDSLDQAKAIALRLSRERTAPASPYKCRDCGKYHIGH